MIFGAVPPRIYIATKPVDFRKGLDGLAAIVLETLKLDPHQAARLSSFGQNAPTGSKFCSGTARV